MENCGRFKRFSFIYIDDNYGRLEFYHYFKTLKLRSTVYEYLVNFETRLLILFRFLIFLIKKMLPQIN